MLEQLNEILKLIPDMLTDVNIWDSLIINRRRPFTYRAFHIFNIGPYKGIRVCLHKFDTCEESEAFFHPHPWPSAMKVLSGAYKMRIGSSVSLDTKPDLMLETILYAGSSYSMPEPRCWHSVQPLSECYSIMINGSPWNDAAHQSAPTTKGKDLEKFSVQELQTHLNKFKTLV